jgi:hypothetical protein
LTDCGSSWLRYSLGAFFRLRSLLHHHFRCPSRRLLKLLNSSLSSPTPVSSPNCLCHHSTIPPPQWEARREVHGPDSSSSRSSSSSSSSETFRHPRNCRQARVIPLSLTSQSPSSSMMAMQHHRRARLCRLVLSPRASVIPQSRWPFDSLVRTLQTFFLHC